MAHNAKAIKLKIKSVANVGKITKAMEKVSAVKMRRAVAAALSAREYAYHLYELLHTLVKHRQMEHAAFVSPKEAVRDLVVIISTDRGLCGGFNVQIQRAVVGIVGDRAATTDAICVGRKAEIVAARAGVDVVSSFVGLREGVAMRDVASIAGAVRDAFSSGTYRRVWVVYNHFVSALSSTPIAYQLLPLSARDLAQSVERLSKGRARSSRHADVASLEYSFEPGRAEALDVIVPKAIDAKLYKMLAESRACEHSARMVAMKNASENAKSIIEELSVSYNRARQEAITREISEIAGAAAAITI